ncbi:looped-hinge helix DNA binding domain-containing protein, AbrB family [Novosphingobium sp. CF614]|uniref:AbrB/MazE/SpoVT family DNA-binding domain-containing protein n=1 Tax=Novosphingobium sp. CF614 TaxID=1884364 RepID=UPI0008E2A5B6|nr:type II toxin-antitoxin system PrlF family antitoxin [Novosphingobium sp. CF614]SFG05183.1 looped-hinge helix DNA binding domain-containing protein, AbrB family [Novosphingobium sp. CF614]
MNVHVPPQHYSSRLTRKFQATIPQAIRDALGLKAGDLVSFTLDANGDVLLGRATDDARRTERAERLQEGVREARRKFAADNALPEGMTSEQWLELMRGPPAEV